MSWGSVREVPALILIGSWAATWLSWWRGGIRRLINAGGRPETFTGIRSSVSLVLVGPLIAVGWIGTP